MEIKELFTVKEAYGSTLLYCENIRAMKKEDYKKIVNMLKALSRVCKNCALVGRKGQLVHSRNGVEWFAYKAKFSPIELKVSMYRTYKILGENKNAHICYLEAKKLK